VINNEVTLVRPQGNINIPALSMSQAIDVNSWSWGWSAVIPVEFADAVMPSPDKVELVATVNGASFVLTVETINRTREFGKGRLQIGNRGRAAILSEPLSPVMSYGNPGDDMTAQQLAVAAITAPGLPLGWEIDWQLEDWLVPQGVWSHIGSPISAVVRIAEAAGGYVQADPQSKVLHVLHRYPVKPWEMELATAGVEVPAEIALTESIEFIDRAPYNRVFVSGQAGGMMGQITRSGSAGDNVAPLVTDPLITHAIAARQRGLAILGDTGRKAMQTLSMPITEDAGIIMPGTLFRFVEGGNSRTGIVRSLNVSTGRPKVRQHLGVEFHGY
jgi:hypothetical protein